MPTPTPSYADFARKLNAAAAEYAAAQLALPAARARLAKAADAYDHANHMMRLVKLADAPPADAGK